MPLLCHILPVSLNLSHLLLAVLLWAMVVVETAVADLLADLVDLMDLMDLMARRVVPQAPLLLLQSSRTTWYRRQW